MSNEHKEAIKEEVKATMSKGSWWLGLTYKVLILVMVSVILNGMTGAKNGAVNVYTAFKTLERDRDIDKQEHLAQKGIDSLQNSAITSIGNRLEKCEIDIAINREAIVDYNTK